jgi:hypothetical protein
VCTISNKVCGHGALYLIPMTNTNISLVIAFGQEDKRIFARPPCCISLNNYNHISYQDPTLHVSLYHSNFQNSRIRHVFVSERGKSYWKASMCVI